jgi:hypothetical protein
VRLLEARDKYQSYKTVWKSSSIHATPEIINDSITSKKINENNQAVFLIIKVNF